MAMPLLRLQKQIISLDKLVSIYEQEKIFPFLDRFF
jgi:hypothetical protein